jgi:hypothetical protein
LIVYSFIRTGCTSKGAHSVDHNTRAERSIFT